jgi:hypothetical protein
MFGRKIKNNSDCCLVDLPAKSSIRLRDWGAMLSSRLTQSCFARRASNYLAVHQRDIVGYRLVLRCDLLVVGVAFDF